MINTSNIKKRKFNNEKVNEAINDIKKEYFTPKLIDAPSITKAVVPSEILKERVQEILRLKEIIQDKKSDVNDIYIYLDGMGFPKKDVKSLIKILENDIEEKRDNIIRVDELLTMIGCPTVMQY